MPEVRKPLDIRLCKNEIFARFLVMTGRRQNKSLYGQYVALPYISSFLLPVALIKRLFLWENKMSTEAPFNGKIDVLHTVEYYETISVFEYDMRTAARLLSEEEQIKVMSYINRLTKNRLPLYGNKSTKRQRYHR